VFAVYVLLLSFFFASRPISDPDFWFHLKLGQFIVQHAQVPRVEIFSCTNLGQPYIAHGWLSGVIFYLIYSRFGQNLLIFIFACLTALAFWIIFKRSTEHIFTRGISVLLGVWTVLPNIGVRPRVFTLLLATCYFHILSRYLTDSNSKRLWWLVPLMVLWVNLHGAFLIGLTFIGLTMGGAAVDVWISRETVGVTWTRVKPLLIILVACALASLFNPYGTRIYSQVLAVLSSPIYQYVGADWLSPDFHQPELFPLIVLILLSTTVLVLSPKRARPSQVLFLLATLFMTFKMQRNAIVFAVVATSLLSDYSGALWDSLFAGPARESTSFSQRRRPSILNLLLLLPLILFVVKVKKVVYVPPTQQMAYVPFHAVEYMKDNGIQGCTFTEPNIWGDYLIWATPANPVYIDGRDVYPTQFVQEYVEIIQGERDWRESFDRYGVTNAILTRSSSLAGQLRKSGEWQQIYEDEYAMVFTRR
jgi:hypothetical protein